MLRIVFVVQQIMTYFNGAVSAEEKTVTTINGKKNLRGL
jgi:hypothetical protein